MDLIIGAGISGISYGVFTKNEFQIIESDTEIGGYCKTVKNGSFVWDYSGHFFHFQNKWLEEFICQNIDKDTILKCKKNTQIKYKDIYVDFPFQKNIHQLEKEEFIDCLYDLFTPREVNYLTFKQMIYSNLGKSIAEKFLIPYNEKLYACDLDNLDVDAMGRFFPHTNKEEIILNFKKADNSSYNTHFTYPKGGAIEYVNSLFSRIDYRKLSLNEEALLIDLATKTLKTNKRELRFDNIISTIPFPQLLNICNIPYNKDDYSWNKVLVFNLGFDKKGIDQTNHWIYFPSKELAFYRIGYYDNIFSDDRMSLYVELGFDKDQEIDIDYFKEKVLTDLKKARIIDDHKLIAYHNVIMNPAYVHISKVSINKVKEQKEYLAKHNIYSIGRYGSWTYCSIEDNILEARNLATMLSKYTQKYN